jgi:uncharacterized protein YicC (UPF0701 family)
MDRKKVKEGSPLPSDLESRLSDLEKRSENHSKAIKQLIREHITKEEQIALLFTLLLDDESVEQLGGVN